MTQHHSMRVRRAAGIAAAVLGLVSAGACSDGTAGRTGRLVVHLTDAPFPYDSVSRVDMFVVRVEARPENVSAAAATNANAGGWTTVAAPNQLINLLDLQHGVTENLGAATLPTGSYRSFRLILDVDQSSITLADGTVLGGNATPGIKFPSAHRTGVKIQLDAPVDITEDSTLMVIDFDVGASFVMRGTSLAQQGLLFKPVVRATARDNSGIVRGTVLAGATPVAGATVELLAPGTTLGDTDPTKVLRTTSTDATGAFDMHFVRPGSYALRVTPPNALALQPVLVPTVAVTTQATTVVPTVTLQ